LNTISNKKDQPQNTSDTTISAIELIDIISTIGAEITKEEMKEFRNSLKKKMQVIFDNQTEEMKLGIIVAGKLNEKEQKAIENIQINQMMGVHHIKTCIAMRTILIGGIKKHQKIPTPKKEL